MTAGPDQQRLVIPPDRVKLEVDDCTLWVEDLMLAQLLLDDVCHVFTATVDGEQTIAVTVRCSDIFAWGCADSEPVRAAELPALYDRHMADPEWGAIKWCICSRGEFPQAPVLKAMKNEGVWDLDESKLRPNQYDRGRGPPP